MFSSLHFFTKDLFISTCMCRRKSCGATLVVMVSDMWTTAQALSSMNADEASYEASSARGLGVFLSASGSPSGPQPSSPPSFVWLFEWVSTDYSCLRVSNSDHNVAELFRMPISDLKVFAQTSTSAHKILHLRSSFKAHLFTSKYSNVS